MSGPGSSGSPGVQGSGSRKRGPDAATLRRRMKRYAEGCQLDSEESLTFDEDEPESDSKKEPESDSNDSSPAWADEPTTGQLCLAIDGMDKDKFARPHIGKRKQTQSAKRKSQQRPDSDSNSGSPAWADSPEQPQASKGRLKHPPKRKGQRRPKSSSSSGAWSENMG